MFISQCGNGMYVLVIKALVKVRNVGGVEHPAIIEPVHIFIEFKSR